MRAAALALVLALGLPAEASGEALYGRWCARCHGERGDGRGPAAPALALNGRAPRDFTRGEFRWKTTSWGTLPTDDDLVRVIREGVPGTAMPFFHDLLSPEETRALAGVVRGFVAAPLPAGSPLDLGSTLPDSPAARRRGAEVYGALGCAACHGETGAGDGASAATLRNADGARAVPTDLRRPWNFRGGADARAIALRVATGIMGTPMPSYREAATPADLWALAHHVLTLAVAPSLRAAAVAAAHRPPGEGEPLARRGAYVARSGTCFLCHVQMQPDGAYVEGSFGAGGMPVEILHVGTYYTRNLTPDPETGIGTWTVRDLRRALRAGVTPEGRRLGSLDMPWTILAGLTDRDVEALHAHLRTLPPVRNLVPPPAAPPLAGQLRGMIGLLATGERVRAGFFPGNAGHVPAGRAVPTVRNPAAPVLVLVGGVVGLAGALLLARRTRGPRRLGALALAAAAVVIPAVYTWPPLRFLPRGLVRGTGPWAPLARVVGLPPIRPPAPPVAIADPDLRALAERGRYVATIGTCSLCHTAGPSVTRLWAPYPEMGGGLEVNWRVFGTTWSRNLTPEPETGLGRWTDAEIVRAITGGIARGGRLMHWQAMPWDHFSNLAPEDLEALVVYLRHLAPAWSRVPEPRGPRPDDLDADTFYFGYAGDYRPAP